MAATSFSRHVYMVIRVVVQAKRNGGSENQSRRICNRRVKVCLLCDGFFSFAVVRQITNILFYFILSMSAYFKMNFSLRICKVEKERVVFEATLSRDYEILLCADIFNDRHSL